jgi:predicted glycosyltransferase
MRILAIDPGIVNLGIALLAFDESFFNIEYNAHKPYRRDEIIQLVNTCKPDLVCIEQQPLHSKIKHEMFYLMGYLHGISIECKMVHPIGKSFKSIKNYKERKAHSVNLVKQVTNQIFDPNVSDAINIALHEYQRSHSTPCLYREALGEQTSP